MKSRPVHRDDVIAILRGVEYLPAARCHLYDINVSDADPDTIWV